MSSVHVYAFLWTLFRCLICEDSDCCCSDCESDFQCVHSSGTFSNGERRNSFGPFRRHSCSETNLEWPPDRETLNHKMKDGVLNAQQRTDDVTDDDLVGYCYETVELVSQDCDDEAEMTLSLPSWLSDDAPVGSYLFTDRGRSVTS